MFKRSYETLGLITINDTTFHSIIHVFEDNDMIL